jgi:transposase
MTDLSDLEWTLVEHLFEPLDERKTCGRPQASARAVLNAIRWIRQSRERWMYLPSTYPPQQTCYGKFLQWKSDGRLSEVERLLGIAPAVLLGETLGRADQNAA